MYACYRSNDFNSLEQGLLRMGANAHAGEIIIGLASNPPGKVKFMHILGAKTPHSDPRHI